MIQRGAFSGNLDQHPKRHYSSCPSLIKQNATWYPGKAAKAMHARGLLFFSKKNMNDYARLVSTTIYSSSMSLCLARTFALNSSGSLSHSSAASPFRGDALRRYVSLSDLPLSDSRGKCRSGVLLIGLAEQTLQAEENSLNIVGSRPLVLEDVEADPAGKVHVGVVDWRFKEDRRCCVGVV
jgi:hypothetical protein